ncbi:MAG TPA: ABC transporter ATP-binding protein [candidate division Zixibacteria bacterium]|nr:ABC transporter ATP-binding protein [candidate division Zixibacteria bacterium]
MRPYVKQVLILSFFLVLYNVIQIINPQIIRYYIDAVFEPTLNTRTILYAALLYIGMNLILRAIMILNEYLSNNLAWATTNDLRIDTTRHCINLDMTFHNKHKTGEMIERIDGDASTLSEFFSTFIVYFLGSILLLIGVLIAVFIEGWIYGVIFLGFTLISLIGLYFVRKISAPLWKKVRESTTEMYGNIEESVSGLEDIKGNGADEFIMKSFHGIAQTNYKNKAKAMIVSRTYYVINVLMNAVLNIGILVTSYYLSNTFGINGGSLFLLLSYGANILFPLRLILWQLEQLQNSLANIERINELLSIETKILDDGNKNFPENEVKLIFEELDFGYLIDELVLQNISFNLEPGKKLGLVGHTGSGKTTIARLIFRLHDPINGKIKFNEYDSREFPLKNLRKNIAYVTQDVELFKASIKDNITFFDKEISDETILKVFQELGLMEWYNKLPNGLDTLIFSEELGLSAGEEQLLALTRAFLKNPKLVILDEASSRLDPATERHVDHALEKLLDNRSAIIIAHRLATLDKVDDILLLKKGEIIEYGSREELVKNPNSQFSILLQKGIEEVLQ